MAHTLRYDAGASAYDRLTGRWSRLYVPGVMTAARVTTGTRVLDIATGTGDAAVHAADQVGPTGQVVAIDISGPMLREAALKAEGRPIQFLKADAQHLPFADGAFHAVVCLFGLMFLPRPAAALAAWRRVLRTSGFVVATCWDRPERAPFAGLVAEALAAQLPADRDDLLRPFSLSNPQTTDALFRSAGFSEVHVSLQTHVSRFRSFADDFWEPIEAGGGRLGQAYLGLGETAREVVRESVLQRLPVRTATDSFSLEHSAWVVVGSG